MNTLTALIKRNVKLFFKDKVLFFTSLITPIILLVLYSTFLAKVFRDSFVSFLPDGTSMRLINGAVAGQLMSSLLAVSCVTVAFSSNMLMVQDKVNGAKDDFAVSPVKSSVVAVAYFVASLCCTLIITLTAAVCCFIYTAAVGWYLSALDVVLLIVDVILLSLFGTGISSLVSYFMTSQGQMSAVGTIIGAGYGFICGAYMPISQYGKVVGHVLCFLPGTYGTSLIRNHAMRGAFSKMQSLGLDAEAVKGIRESVDCTLYFFGHRVSVGGMYAVLIISCALLIGAYVLINKFARKTHK